MSTLADRVFALTDSEGNSVLLSREVVEREEFVVLFVGDGGACLVPRHILLKSHIAATGDETTGPITEEEAAALVTATAPNSAGESMILRCPDGGYYVLSQEVVSSARLAEEDIGELETLLGREVTGFAGPGDPAAFVGYAAPTEGFRIDVRRLDRTSVIASRGFDFGRFVS